MQEKPFTGLKSSSPKTAEVQQEEAKPPFALALDVGTSSARAQLFDSLSREVEGVGARQEYQIPVQADGTVEIDANRLLGTVWDCVDSTLRQAGRLSEAIAGVSACTFVSNVLGVDDHGQAVTRVFTYADTRAAPEAAALRQQLDEEQVHQRTGCHFHPSYLPARFLWLKREHPEFLKRARRWMSLGELMLLNLFGETSVSYSVASWTGLLNHREMAWDRELLAVLPISEDQLSPLCDASEQFRGLLPGFADRWPALARVPWLPPIGDGAAANLGSGCTTSDRVAISMGTSSAVRAILPGAEPQVPLGLWRYRVDRPRALLGGALTEGGSLIAWLRQLLNLQNLPDLEATLAAMPSDEHGLTFLPLVAGERSPGWVAEARGAVSGLSLATTPLEFLRAGIEGVAYRIAQVYDLLAPLLPGEVEVVASGGTFRYYPFLVPLLADVLGVPVRASLVPEPSARGAALLALETLHLLPDVSQAPDFLGPASQPDKDRHARYRQAMQRQQELYSRVIR